MIAALAGGVGAARLLRGMVEVVPPSAITAIVNTGDDTVLHGLHIAPDLDTVMYTLADAINPETGWGLAGETWRVMESLGRLGGVTWFNLGDQDLATHCYRTQRLNEGATLGQVTAELAHAWGLDIRLLPVTDDPLRTRLQLVDGPEVGFQEYFVRLHHEVPVAAVRFEGAAEARPGPGVLEAVDSADVIVVCPSNPVVSVGPLLAVPGIAERLAGGGTGSSGSPPSSPAPPSRARPTGCSGRWASRSSVVGVARWYAPCDGHPGDRRGRRRTGRRGGGRGRPLPGRPHRHVHPAALGGAVPDGARCPLLSLGRPTPPLEEPGFRLDRPAAGRRALCLPGDWDGRGPVR